LNTCTFMKFPKLIMKLDWQLQVIFRFWICERSKLFVSMRYSVPDRTFLAVHHFWPFHKLLWTFLTLRNGRNVERSRRQITSDRLTQQVKRSEALMLNMMNGLKCLQNHIHDTLTLQKRKNHCTKRGRKLYGHLK